MALAAEQGFDAVELHTGAYSNSDRRGAAEQLERLNQAGRLAEQRKLRLHAGHGLNYRNVGPVAAIEGIRELNIGHAIISRAIFVGIRQATAEMKRAMENTGG